MIKNSVEKQFDTNITLENFLKICDKFGPLFPYSPCLSEKLEVSSYKERFFSRTVGALCM